MAHNGLDVRDGWDFQGKRSRPHMTDAPDPFDALLSRLRDDPALGNLLDPDAPVLVWNEDGGKLLWSSPSAADLGASLVDQAASLRAGSRAMQRLRALAGGQ